MIGDPVTEPADDPGVNLEGLTPKGDGTFYGRFEDVPIGWECQITEDEHWTPKAHQTIYNRAIIRCRPRGPKTEWIPWYLAAGRFLPDGRQIEGVHRHKDHRPYMNLIGESNAPIAPARFIRDSGGATLFEVVVELSGESTTSDNPLAVICELCHVRFSTEDCLHLLDLGDGRIIMPRHVWEGLVEDRHRLRDLER
jgi:hypothetical protein